MSSVEMTMDVANTNTAGGRDNRPILVTGAAGQLGAVGRTVTGLLLDRGLPVRALVRRDDDRAAALRAAGAEVVVGDLIEPADVFRAVSGSRRVYFGISVSAGYLEATMIMATVAREVGVDALVNMSQMTVSQMSIQNTTTRRASNREVNHGHLFANAVCFSRGGCVPSIDQPVWDTWRYNVPPCASLINNSRPRRYVPLSRNS